MAIGITATSLGLADSHAQSPPPFQGLGHLSVRSDGARFSYPVELSGDGSTVVGYSNIYSGSTYLGRLPFRWRNGSLQNLGALSYNSYGYRYALPTDVSWDGSAVSGYSNIYSGTNYRGREGFRWAGGSMQSIGTLSYRSDGYRFSFASGISANGSAISAYYERYSGSTYLGTEALRWFNGSRQPLGSLSYGSGGRRRSFGLDISAGGNVIVGYAGIYNGPTSVGSNRPFRWANGSMQDLGVISSTSSGYSFASAHLVSADGSSAVGYANIYGGSQSYGRQLFRWKNGIRTVLPPLSYHPNGYRNAYPYAVSADGSTIVGYSSVYSGTSYRGIRAFRWRNGLMQNLGLLYSYSGSYYGDSNALDVSSDGNTVVGYASPPRPGSRHTAFVWTPQTGMRDIGAILESDYGVNLSQWTLYEATEVSADGTVIAGRGIRRVGSRSYWEPWIARLGARNSAPTLTCPSPGQTFECDSSTTDDNEPGALAELEATVTDTDGDALTVTWKVGGVVEQVTSGVTSGTVVTFSHSYPLGASTVEVSVNDGTVTESCSTVVTVVDTTLPALTCQPPVSATTDPGDCVATGVSLLPPSVSDTCEVASLSNDAPAIFPLGETIVTWTIIDVAGNQATCEQLVTVSDDEAPSFTCPPDIEVGHDPGSTIASSVILGLPSDVSDNCDPDGDTVQIEALEPSDYELGENTVTWVATDSAGNVTTCDQTVTVTNDDPVVTCPEAQTLECEDIIGTDGDGAIATIVTLNATVADGDDDPLNISWLVNGVEVSATEGVAAGSTVSLVHAFDYGDSTVELVVDDTIAEVSCEVQVSIVDTTVPIAVCNEDVEVGTDPGTCEATGVVLPEPTISDNCDIVSLTNDAPSVYPLGDTTVTWTVTDIGGNSATCTQTVTVIDDEAPVIVAPANLVVAHDSNECLASNVSLGTPSATDNCGVVGITNNAPATFPLGDTTVVWEATDAAGNIGFAFQTVTVTNEAPVADAGENVVAECLDGGAIVTLDGTESSDLEGDDLIYQWSAVGITFDDATSSTPTAKFPMGSHQVTLVVEDSCGAMDSSTVFVLVQDTVAPVIQVTAVSREILWPPNHKMIPVGITIVVSDDCKAADELVVNCTVTSSEPDDTTGDGSTTGDVGGQDGHSAPVPVQMSYDADSGSWIGTIDLRAERRGGGDGRKYDISCSVSDGPNTSVSTACVVVPKSQGKGKGK